jgi:hypothetical protein
MALGVLLCYCATLSAKDAAKLEEALAEPVSLAFERNSLEMSLQALEKAVRAKHPEFSLRILGDDLKLEGITRNQAIRNYEATGKPAAEILTELVRKANPVRDVTGPSDPNLKLIWIVGANPDNADELAILITTRAAAAKRSDKVPKVFKPE